MELDGSLPHSQQPATSLYPVPDRSSPWSPWVFQVVVFPQVSPPKLSMHLSPIRATCPACFSVLDLIVQGMKLLVINYPLTFTVTGAGFVREPSGWAQLRWICSCLRAKFQCVTLSGLFGTGGCRPHIRVFVNISVTSRQLADHSLRTIQNEIF